MEIGSLGKHNEDHRAIIDGNERAFNRSASINEWRKFRTDELWDLRDMDWRAMCKVLLSNERVLFGRALKRSQLELSARLPMLLHDENTGENSGNKAGRKTSAH